MNVFKKAIGKLLGHSVHHYDGAKFLRLLGWEPIKVDSIWYWKDPHGHRYWASMYPIEDALYLELGNLMSDFIAKKKETPNE